MLAKEVFAAAVSFVIPGVVVNLGNLDVGLSVSCWN